MHTFSLQHLLHLELSQGKKHRPVLHNCIVLRSCSLLFIGCAQQALLLVNTNTKTEGTDVLPSRHSPALTRVKEIQYTLTAPVEHMEISHKEQRQTGSPESTSHKPLMFSTTFSPKWYQPKQRWNCLVPPWDEERNSLKTGG